MNREKIRKTNRIYPWFSGLSADLLFFIAIDSLWYTVVKGFGYSEVLGIITIGSVAALSLQKPMLKVIEKTGNTIAVRAGVVMMLTGAVLLTFSKSFAMMALGQSFYLFGGSAKSLDAALLKNNLNLLGEPEERFVSLRNRAMTIYSAVTCVIAFAAGPLFNYNNYLPMYFCIGFCLLDLVLSFFIRDYSDGVLAKERRAQRLETNGSERGPEPHQNGSAPGPEPRADGSPQNSKCAPAGSAAEKKGAARLSPLILMFVVLFAIFLPAITSGQCNGKLFMQDQLMRDYSVSETAYMLTFSIAVSRVVRILANAFFDAIYMRLGEKTLPVFAGAFALAFVIVTGSTVLPFSPAVRFVIMSAGYSIFLAVRDPLTTFIQGEILKRTDRNLQQKALVTANFLAETVGTAANLSFTAVLLKGTMMTVMLITFAMSAVCLVLALKIYSIITIDIEKI